MASEVARIVALAWLLRAALGAGDSISAEASSVEALSDVTGAPGTPDRWRLCASRGTHLLLHFMPRQMDADSLNRQVLWRETDDTIRNVGLALIESELDEHHPTILVENIRRQLMNENYDYMPSESEEIFPVKHELSEEADSPTADRRSGTLDLDSDINDNFIQHTTNDRETQKEKGVVNDKSHAISKKDLLYYLDDDRLKHEDEDVAAAVEATTTTLEEPTSPNVTYKVLKVKDPHPSRRSQAFKRFIQEEGKDGVVIINLNEEPFPEFRLPRARRQYMMDQHDLDSEMEIAGPSEEG